MWTTRILPGGLAMFVAIVSFGIDSITSVVAGEKRFGVRDSVEMAQFTEQAIFFP